MRLSKRMLLPVLCLILTLSCALPAAAAESAPDAAALADSLLAEVRASQKDPWVLAILDAGADGAAVTEENALVFSLRSFDPQLKTLGAYNKAEDPSAWLTSMLENVSARSLTVSVPLTEDGTVSGKARQAFLEKVSSAAKASRTAFQNDSMQLALRDVFFPAPADSKNLTAEKLLAGTEVFAARLSRNPAVKDASIPWAPLFHVQRNVKIGVKNGPHALSLTWDGADPDRLLSQAYYTASGELAQTPAESRVSRDSLRSFFDTALANAAIKMKQGRVSSFTASFDLDELCAGDAPADYAAYLARYDYASRLARITAEYDVLPAEASQPFPKTGKLSGPAKGRTIPVKNKSDVAAAYVQMRDADTNAVISDAFIAAGKTVNMIVSEGYYYVQFAQGASWYGPEAVFGPTGTYMASDEFIVGKQKRTMTVMEAPDGLTLHPVGVSAFASSEAHETLIPGVLEARTELKEYPAVNPVIPGVSSLTGLPASGGPYTPIVVVLDNAEEAYPHWGVSQADIVFQVPNAGSGATKLLGLFASQYPVQAGPVRSGRASMLPAAMSFNAAFAFAGPPAVKSGNIDIEALMSKWGMSSTHRVYNLLNNNGYQERIKGYSRSHDMSCHVAAIHDNLVQKNVAFEERPFLFTDEPRADGDPAKIIRVLHRGEESTTAVNSASRAVFIYDESTGAYSRRNSSGLYLDRDTGGEVQFANVIVLRTKLSYEKNYVYLKNHLVGSGAADVFQSGHYIPCSWVRDDVSSRLIFVDESGEELRFQRGKTFIVMTNEITDVVVGE